MSDYRCHICGAGIMIGTGAHHRCRETIETMQEKLGDRATARVIAPEPVRASRSAPSPEPESAGARERNWAKAHPDLADALDFDGKPVCRAQHGSTGTYCTRRPGHDGAHVAGSWTVGWYAARWAAIPAPAPRAAGGTTATDPEIGRLLDVLMASVELDGYHGDEEDEPAACRAAVEAAFRTIATERADAEAERDRAWAQVDESGRVLIATVRDRDAALARAESAEARVSEITRERAEYAEAAASEASLRRSALARVSELEAALGGLRGALERGAEVLDMATSFAEETQRIHYDAGFFPGERTAHLVKDACRSAEKTLRAALASRPPAATEGEGGTP
jgi:hypothetical protein